jgi:hypothetical protein
MDTLAAYLSARAVGAKECDPHKMLVPVTLQEY